jgi:hypothetical protein
MFSLRCAAPSPHSVHARLRTACALAMCLIPMATPAQAPSQIGGDIVARSPADPAPERPSPAFSDARLQGLWEEAMTRFAVELSRRQGWAGATITPLRASALSLESSERLALHLRPLPDHRPLAQAHLWVDLRRDGRTVGTIELPVRIVPEPDSGAGAPTREDIAQTQPGATVQARLRTGALTIERRATLMDSPFARASVRLRMPLGNIVTAALSADGHTYDILQEGANP